MIGDDAVRDRRLAVGVVATEDGVVTLRMSPQKFLASLDPLTLRLFSRIRQQQDGALQVGAGAGAAAGPAAAAAAKYELCLEPPMDWVSFLSPQVACNHQAG